MSVKSRVLGLKLLEKQKKNPEYAKQIGIDVKVIKNEKEVKKNGQVRSS